MEQLPLNDKWPRAGTRADRKRVAAPKKKKKVQLSLGGTQLGLPLTQEPKIRAKCPECGKSVLGMKQHIINVHGAIAGEDFIEGKKRPKPKVEPPQMKKSVEPTPQSKNNAEGAARDKMNGSQFKCTHCHPHTFVKKADRWRHLKAKHPAEHKRLNKLLDREKKLQKEEEKKSKREGRNDYYINISPEVKRPVSGGAVGLGKK